MLDVFVEVAEFFGGGIALVGELRGE